MDTHMGEANYVRRHVSLDSIKESAKNYTVSQSYTGSWVMDPHREPHHSPQSEPTGDPEELTGQPEELKWEPKLEGRKEEAVVLGMSDQTHQSHCDQALGFRHRDFLSLSDLTRLLHRPCDPAALATTRIVFGMLMFLDVPQERGLGVADLRWGDPDDCRFPLISHLSPLPLHYMVLLYGVMLVCSVLMVLGWRWRVSCGSFVAVYWYLFLLDKTTWNNHSYLYGLIASILLVSDPHRCWSVDGAGKDSHVPLWNYAHSGPKSSCCTFWRA
ncbi:vitamin K-dependent gamma-carboxylase-like [Homarus americanus]|uniref:vitamin K-dependent gamma-carboxylase-like n=1 Tax=Homarus americanus TaxID=6706 RepID=UPI001C493F8E|nr:vitamin K-dependent gamma-carboxylase-like [Homarus americanus]